MYGICLRVCIVSQLRYTDHLLQIIDRYKTFHYKIVWGLVSKKQDISIFCPFYCHMVCNQKWRNIKVHETASFHLIQSFSFWCQQRINSLIIKHQTSGIGDRSITFAKYNKCNRNWQNITFQLLIISITRWIEYELESACNL